MKEKGKSHKDERANSVSILQDEVDAHKLFVRELKESVKTCSNYETLYWDIVESYEKQREENRGILFEFNFDPYIGSFTGSCEMRGRDLDRFIFAYQEGYLADRALAWLRFNAKRYLEGTPLPFFELVKAHVDFCCKPNLVPRSQLRKNPNVAHFDCAQEAECSAFRYVASVFREQGFHVGEHYAINLFAMQIAIWAACIPSSLRLKRAEAHLAASTLGPAYEVVQDLLRSSQNAGIPEIIIQRQRNLASRVHWKLEKEHGLNLIRRRSADIEKLKSAEPMRDVNREDSFILDEAFQKLKALSLRPNSNECRYRDLVIQDRNLWLRGGNKRAADQLGFSEDQARRIRCRLREKVGLPKQESKQRHPKKL